MFERTGSAYCKDGEDWSNRTEGGGSRHAEEREGNGAVGGGPLADRMPRLPRKAPRVTRSAIKQTPDGGDGGRAHRGER